MKSPKRHLLLVVSALLLAARADASPSKVSAILTPEQETLVLGEPVLMRVRLQNEDAEPVRIDLGSDFESSVRFVVNGIDQPPPGLPPEGGFSIPGKVTIKPGKSYSRLYLLNQWSPFDQAGRYEVRFLLDSLPSVEATTTLVVAPRDSEILAKACARLAGQAESYEAEPALLAAKALSYVGDEACLGSLTEVVRKSFHGKEGAITGLLRIGTESALRALAESWDALRWDQQALAFNEAEQRGKKEALKKALLKSGRSDTVKPPGVD
jgi:hypothetical protein